MKELALLHDKHMNRPTLDDSSEEEHAIEITTQEITQVNSFSMRVNLGHRDTFLCQIQISRPCALVTLLFTVADVPSVPASCDGAAVALWPLHRAGGEVAEERGLLPRAKPAGAVH